MHVATQRSRDRFFIKKSPVSPIAVPFVVGAVVADFVGSNVAREFDQRVQVLCAVDPDRAPPGHLEQGVPCFHPLDKVQNAGTVKIVDLVHKAVAPCAL